MACTCNAVDCGRGSGHESYCGKPEICAAPMSDCLNPEAHSSNGGPFRYCACGWVEESDDDGPTPEQVERLVADFAHLDIRPLAIQQANSQLSYLAGMADNWTRNGDDYHGAMLQCLCMAFRFQQVENERLDLVNQTLRAQCRALGVANEG